MKILKPLLISSLLVFMATSCRTPKDITYFQDFDPGMTLDVVPISEVTAMPDDRISIVVHSKDAALAEIFNLPLQSRRVGTTGTRSTGTGVASYGSGQSSYYVVDRFGNIDFPILGELHVEGLTRLQIAKLIKNALISRELLKDPTVTVEFMDHSFTALGAFGHPGRIIFERDRLNIIEAIGLAGDLQLNGQRKNVKVIRMEDDGEKVYTVDLTDAESLYKSPVFYIQQNDVIYVEPNNLTKRNTTPLGNQPLTPGFWISLASFALSIVLLIVKW